MSRVFSNLENQSTGLSNENINSDTHQVHNQHTQDSPKLQ